MTAVILEEKRHRILDYETALANRLARKVLEKPTPPIWMILIPIFFVFFAAKLHEYSRGLQSFADHYLVSRRRALDAACEAVLRDCEPDIDGLLARSEAIPETARPLYLEWITLLTSHYRHLLVADGSNVAEMTRGHYRSKTNFLLFTNQLNRAESCFNNALLPSIEGDQQDIHFIAERLQRGTEELRRQEAEILFS